MRTQNNLFSEVGKHTRDVSILLEEKSELIRPAKAITNGNLNKVRPEDSAVHDWYRFVLSFPPHLVRHYLSKFNVRSGQQVLDPFCGTGTTLVECKKLGIESVGIEANPIAHFASTVKIDWSPSPRALERHAERIAEAATATLESQGFLDSLELFEKYPDDLKLATLSETKQKLLLKDSISPRPLHKTLILLEQIESKRSVKFNNHERLALAKALVSSISNLHFGPEVGVGKAKVDAPVVSPWIQNVKAIARDLDIHTGNSINAKTFHADSRDLVRLLPPRSIDAVITSPPYPNEKDYTRTTRLESVLLGFIDDKEGLRRLKQGLVRSNTRNVYKGDEEDRLVDDNAKIQRIAREIEDRRIELKKTSGFERLYARVTKLYFGGMKKHLLDLRKVLKPGARLAYVVGDQASYLRVMIRTGEILEEIADSIGYVVETRDLFRTRLATATKEQLREEVVILTWPGR